MTDKDRALPKPAAMFARLPFERKLSLSAHPQPEIDCAVLVPDYAVNGAMMFRRLLRHFDCAYWLKTGEIRRSALQAWFNKLVYAWSV